MESSAYPVLLIVSFPLEHEKSDFTQAVLQGQNPCLPYLSWTREKGKDDENPSEGWYSLAGLPNTIIGIIEFKVRTAKMIGGSFHGRLLSPETSHTQTVMTIALEISAWEIGAY